MTFQRQITDAVHSKGSFIYMQIWALGRAARITELRKEQPDFPYVSASDVPLTGRTDIPRPLTIAGQNVSRYTMQMKVLTRD